MCNNCDNLSNFAKLLLSKIVNSRKLMKSKIQLNRTIKTYSKLQMKSKSLWKYYESIHHNQFSYFKKLLQFNQLHIFLSTQDKNRNNYIVKLTFFAKTHKVNAKGNVIKFFFYRLNCKSKFTAIFNFDPTATKSMKLYCPIFLMRVQDKHPEERLYSSLFMNSFAINLISSNLCRTVMQIKLKSRQK